MTPTLKRIDRAMTTLVLDFPWFATLALRLKISENPSVSTFCTDGKVMLVNPEFEKTLDERTILTVVCHEVMHAVLGHIWRLDPTSYSNQMARNAAADYEANAMLNECNVKAKSKGQDEPFPVPKCGWLYDKQYDGVAAEIIYRKLMENAVKLPDNPSMGEFTPGTSDKAAMEQLKEEWEKALIQAAEVSAASGRGDMPASMDRRIQKIIRPRVDWRQVMRDFCRQTAMEDYSFSRANRRYIDTGFYMPSLYSERMGRMVFTIDTSGSITPQLLAEYIGQCSLVLDEFGPDPLTIICHDAAVTRCEDYQPGDHIPDDAPGGGGTSHSCVWEKIETFADPPVCVVCLTDLATEFGNEPEYPVLWIVLDGCTNKPPFGELVKVED